MLGPLRVARGAGGDVDASLEGNVTTIGWPRQRLVLALLVARANEVVPLERLVDDVWGPDPPSRPRKTVQVYVANLRRALGPEHGIASEPSGYRLVSGRGDIDALRFTDLVHEARCRVTADPARAVEDYARGLDLWRGEVFADVPWCEALRPYVVWLDALRLAALEERLALELRLGRSERVVAELEARVLAHPLRERLWELLMHALYLAGRQADALAAYQRARAILVGEVGVEPSAGLRTMEQRILCHDPSLDVAPGGAGLPRATLRPAATPTPIPTTRCSPRPRSGGCRAGVVRPSHPLTARRHGGAWPQSGHHRPPGGTAMAMTMERATASVPETLKKLQAQWYNALIDGLGVSPDRFQILQPTSPLGNTSDTLWAYFDNIPPRSLTARATPSGGNQFYSDYDAVVQQLLVPDDVAFQRDLGDDYVKWLAHVATLNPRPVGDKIVQAFMDWAIIYCPDKAPQGAADLQSALHNPIFEAKLAAPNKTRFINGVPDYSQTIDDLRKNAIPSGAQCRVSFDSTTQSSDTSKTWAGGEVTGRYDFFTARVGGSYEQLNRKAMSSRITMDVTFTHAVTFSARPGQWYASSALAAAYSTPDNTLWKHGVPTWESTFGPDGTMLRFTTALVVVDGIQSTMTCDASFDAAEQEEIKASASVGIWPFFELGGSGGHATQTTFDEQGRLKVTVGNSAGNPCVLGLEVVPVKEFLGGGGPATDGPA